MKRDWNPATEFQSPNYVNYYSLKSCVRNDFPVLSSLHWDVHATDVIHPQNIHTIVIQFLAGKQLLNTLLHNNSLSF